MIDTGFRKRQMTARLFIAAFVLPTFAASAEPLFPDGLKQQAAPVTRLLSYREGVLIGGDGDPFFANFETLRAVPFRVEGLSKILGSEQTGSGHAFLGTAEDRLKLVIEAGDGKRDLIALPVEIERLAPAGPQVPRLIPSTGRAALMSSGVLWWREDNAWKSLKLPPVPRFDPAFHPEGSRESHFLLGDILFAGWAKGEFGGLLAAIDVTAGEPRWRNSGREIPHVIPGLARYLPVLSMVSANGSDLWVHSGLSHRGWTRNALSYRNREGLWRHLSDEIREGREGHLGLREGNQIAAVAADAGGRLHLALFPAGIDLAGKGPEPVLKIGFDQYSKGEGENRVTCYPTGLAIRRQGDIFVATNAFGILAFRKEGEKWKGRQIMTQHD